MTGSACPPFKIPIGGRCWARRKTALLVDQVPAENSASSMASNAKGAWKPASAVTFFCPESEVGPMPQVKRTDFREGDVCVAEQVGDCGFICAEMAAISEMGIQDRQRRPGALAMIFGDHRIDVDWQQVSLTELNGVAIEDRWKQHVDVPVQPLAHGLARRRIGPPKPIECLGQMLNDGRRLKVGSTVVDQNRHLAPARQRQEFGRLVHILLVAYVAKRKRCAGQAQHQCYLVGRKRMRTAIEREAIHGWSSCLNDRRSYVSTPWIPRVGQA